MACWPFILAKCVRQGDERFTYVCRSAISINKLSYAIQDSPPCRRTPIFCFFRPIFHATFTRWLAFIGSAARPAGCHPGKSASAYQFDD